MQALLQMLNGIHPLSPELQTHLQINLKRKVLKKREYLLKKGHVCSTINFISTGLLHCYYPEGSKKVSSWFMQENNVIISVSSFFSQRISYESIWALEESELFYITYSELQAIYQEFQEFNIVGRILTEKYYMLKDEHSHQLQIGTASERFEWFLKTFPDLILRVPARYIATFLGISEYTLSRIRSK